MEALSDKMFSETNTSIDDAVRKLEALGTNVN